MTPCTTPCAQCKAVHFDDCCSAVYPAEIIDAIPIEPQAPAPTIGGLVDDALKALGWRITPSPLPLAAALFGAPGWFVPATLATVAGAGIYALYATGKIGRTVRKRSTKRRRGRR